MFEPSSVHRIVKRESFGTVNKVIQSDEGEFRGDKET